MTPDSESFLSIGSNTEIYAHKPMIRKKFVARNDDWSQAYPSVFVILRLSGMKFVYQRTAYTFMEMLSDFGGFNDGIYFVFSLFLSLYSSMSFAN